MKLYFIGDPHGKWLQLENDIVFRDIKDAYIWSVGDGAFGLHNNRRSDKDILDRLNNFLSSRNIILYNTRGNHDNPYWFKSESALLKQLKSEDKNIKSWMKENYYYVHYYINPIEFSHYIKNLSNIKFVKDYDIVNLNGLNILNIGGAISIDRKQHLQDGSYFPNEKITFSNKVYSIKNVDVVVSHSAPIFLEPTKFHDLVYEFQKHDVNLTYELTQERKLLEKIYNELIKKNHISYWVYGHYHSSSLQDYNGTNFCCLSVLELLELFDTDNLTSNSDTL
jgi:hypothetical protein